MYVCFYLFVGGPIGRRGPYRLDPLFDDDDDDDDGDGDDDDDDDDGDG